MLVGSSLDGVGLGEDDDKITTDRSSGGLVGGRSHDSHGSKWSAHWRISTSSVEPEFLWPLRPPLWPLRLPSLLRLILAIPPWLATGTIIALAGRGEVTTRSQLVKRWAQSSSAPRASLPQAAAIQIATIALIGWE